MSQWITTLLLLISLFSSSFISLPVQTGDLDAACETIDLTEHIIASQQKEIKQLKEQMCHLQSHYSDKIKIKKGYEVDQNIDDRLLYALGDYDGPKEIGTTSMKRHGNGLSLHDHGLALDLEICTETITYLESDKGQKWLDKHHLTYIIEFPEETKKYKHFVSKYKKVIVNPKATGLHFHLQLKRKYV